MALLEPSPSPCPSFGCSPAASVVFYVEVPNPRTGGEASPVQSRTVPPSMLSLMLPRTGMWLQGTADSDPPSHPPGPFPELLSSLWVHPGLPQLRCRIWHLPVLNLTQLVIHSPWICPGLCRAPLPFGSFVPSADFPGVPRATSSSPVKVLKGTGPELEPCGSLALQRNFPNIWIAQSGVSVGLAVPLLHFQGACAGSLGVQWDFSPAVCCCSELCGLE